MINYQILLFAAIAICSTGLGGMLALKFQDRTHRILGFTAGVLLGVVAFELLPHIFEISTELQLDTAWLMVALVAGFLLFHILEKSILIHHSQEANYEIHHHPQVGVAGALALIGHSFLDGFGIGLGFLVDPALGVAVAIAVVAHGFSDGLNTINVMLVNGNQPRRAVVFLILDALAPFVGALAAIIVTPPESWVAVFLSFVAGFFLYIGASEILPEAHSKRSSYATILLTITGAALIFGLSLFH